ncbi:unnamed protein product [Parnassius mnemosyne]|uniref:Reverse transcriptase domain-containing protein n=1 Tax=Parnassius mnemosyne TaxID=213953 RepID=A0AAV1LMD8_9NEOP
MVFTNLDCPKKIDASGQQKWRIVIDYRKLNDITVGASYPIPQISEILDELGQSKYFSTLDLASGFHQILINVEDAPKTAFSVPQGHYQFTKMPFGLKNAPATFQRLMNTALTGLQGIRCFVYLDNIVIYSHDLNSHIDNLSSVFQRLRNYNLKLQPDKCEFLRREVAYLGHQITKDGVNPNPEKVKAVTQFPTPKSPKDIKSFLGLVSYYRRFIANFSEIAKSLTQLLKKGVPFLWENQQQVAFDELKHKLTSAPILIYPDFSIPFILTCDASNYAVAAVLSQGPIGKDRPIAFASRTLNESEYPSSKLQRWHLKLIEYEYEIEYKKGKLNAATDALSRYPVNPVQPSDSGPIPSNSNQNEDNSTPQFSRLTLDDLDIQLHPDSLDLDYKLSSVDLLENDDSLPGIDDPPTPTTSDKSPDPIPNPSRDNNYSKFLKTMGNKDFNSITIVIIVFIMCFIIYKMYKTCIHKKIMKSKENKTPEFKDIELDDSNPSNINTGPSLRIG